MKYGGVGGWRAIKRFNRDARIAEGQSPYGYRTRYASVGSSGSGTTTESRGWQWAVALSRARDLADNMLAFESNVISREQREELHSKARALRSSVEASLAERPGFWGSLFGGQDRWVSRHQPQVSAALEAASGPYRRLTALAESRGKLLKKQAKAINGFVRAIEGRYVDPLEGLTVEEEARLKRYDVATESENNTVPANWDEMSNQVARRTKAIVEYASVALELFERHGSVPAPALDWEPSTQTLTVGDLQLNLSTGSAKLGKSRKPKSAK